MKRTQTELAEEKRRQLMLELLDQGYTMFQLGKIFGVERMHIARRIRKARNEREQLAVTEK